MSATYRLNIDELDQSFLENLKATFGGKSVEIVVSEVPAVEVLYDFSANESDPSVNSDDTHVDDGRISSFLASGKSKLIGRNGEKPVGRLVRVKAGQPFNENRSKWQAFFDELDKLPPDDSSQLNLTKQERREIIADDLAKKHRWQSESS